MPESQQQTNLKNKKKLRFPHENNITAKMAVMLNRIAILTKPFNYFLALIVVDSPIQPPTL